jgi:hypothetical protein
VIVCADKDRKCASSHNEPLVAKRIDTRIPYSPQMLFILEIMVVGVVRDFNHFCCRGVLIVRERIREFE